MLDIEEPLFSLQKKNYVVHFFSNDNRWDSFLNVHKDLLKKITFSAFASVELVTDENRLDHINLIFCNDTDIHKINKEYRKMDKPTNVLSFPAYDPIELMIQAYGFGDEQYFGDIFIAYDYCLNEAKQTHKKFEYHIAHMIVHGILHIFGHDHIEDQDAEKMEKLEAKLLQAVGIENPYV